MSAPGENSPSKRDIVELELLLKRLYELQERADPVGDAEEGEVILSDRQQLNRMLSSLNALYRDGTPRDLQKASSRSQVRDKDIALPHRE